jgi:hypothetical protein
VEELERIRTKHAVDERAERQQKETDEKRLETVKDKAPKKAKDNAGFIPPRPWLVRADVIFLASILAVVLELYFMMLILEDRVVSVRNLSWLYGLVYL